MTAPQYPHEVKKKNLQTKKADVTTADFQSGGVEIASGEDL